MCVCVCVCACAFDTNGLRIGVCELFHILLKIYYPFIFACTNCLHHYQKKDIDFSRTKQAENKKNTSVHRGEAWKIRSKAINKIELFEHFCFARI